MQPSKDATSKPTPIIKNPASINQTIYISSQTVVSMKLLKRLRESRRVNNYPAGNGRLAQTQRSRRKRASVHFAGVTAAAALFHTPVITLHRLSANFDTGLGSTCARVRGAPRGKVSSQRRNYSREREWSGTGGGKASGSQVQD